MRRETARTTTGTGLTDKTPKRWRLSLLRPASLMVALVLLVFSSSGHSVGAEGQASAHDSKDVVPLMVSFKNGQQALDMNGLAGTDTLIKQVYSLIPAVALSVPAEGADEAIEKIPG